MEQGHSYSRLSAGTKRRKKSDANELIRALRNSQKPLVVHNGLLDLLHLYHSFIGDLPADVSSFCRCFTEHFPTLFDTRHLAQEGRYHVLKHAGSLSLEALQRVLEKDDLRCSVIGDRGTAHGSAGHDAQLTAKAKSDSAAIYIYICYNYSFSCFLYFAFHFCGVYLDPEVEVLVLQLQRWVRLAHLEELKERRELWRQERLKELELEAPHWQDVHRLALDLGISIFRQDVSGRFGGAKGARRPVAEIRGDVAAAQCPLEEQSTEASWERLTSHRATERFRNVLAIMGASPGHLCLSEKW